MAKDKEKVEDTKNHESMFTDQINPEMLRAAFAVVKRNRGCGGVDAVSLKQYERALEINLRELVRTIRSGIYRPLPVRKVGIPKPNGKIRPLGIPAIRDRVVQQAVLMAVQGDIDPRFSAASFGFRPGKSAHQAMDQIDQYLNEGYTMIVDADIMDFFGTLNQQILMAKVRAAIPDRSITRLIWQFLRAGIMEEGKFRLATTGTPQGGVISPLLANLYLNEFDYAIERAGLKLVRYADDFVILCQSVNQAVAAFKLVRAQLRKLRLALAEEKTKITDCRAGFDFLGYHFQEFYGNKRWPRHKAVQSFKDKVRRATRRQQPKNVAQIIKELNPLIRGWGNYFRRGNSKTCFERLDGWIRMRLRSFIEKKKWPTSMNWKYPTDHFLGLGLVCLLPLRAVKSSALQLSFSGMEQPARRAVCGKSARTVR